MESKPSPKGENVRAQLTKKFRQRVEDLNVTETAIADMLKISRQHYNRVWRGLEAPSTRFMVMAVAAGLGKTFDDIAEPVIHRTKEDAAA